VQRICTGFKSAEPGTNHFTEMICERSLSASGIKRTHGCKRTGVTENENGMHIPAGSEDGFYTVQLPGMPGTEY